MKRVPPSALAAVLAMLLGCVLVMWVRSYGEGDFFGWETMSASTERGIAHKRTRGLYSAAGGVGAGLFEWVSTDPQQVAKVKSERAMDGSFTVHPVSTPHYPFVYGNDETSLLGFLARWNTHSPSPGTMQTDHGVVIPYWFVALLFAIAPGRYLLGRLRSRVLLRESSTANE